MHLLVLERGRFEVLALLTHGAVKKSQKADRSEVEKAGRLRAAYLAAKAAGAITMEDWSRGR